MPLSEGDKLGPYEVLAAIGSGGMGDVYQARDTTLDRDVAIKVLPDAFADDPERLARFEREAKLLAALNHPNIASIYGLEKSGATRALVMELIEGPTLAERIREGALTLEDALPIAKQITEALNAAHEQGIIHRDLKPANIKVAPDGMVKVLDFGLAKALQEETHGADVSQSPTLTRGTAVGVILGTASYMSPEQAKGRVVDTRTDIWAFGCVLYELLTGNKAFPGDDASEALAAVIRAEPELDRLPVKTPSAIRRLLRRCLIKDTHDRLAHIADARIELAEADTSDFPVATGAPTARYRPQWLILTAGLMALTWLAARNRTPPDLTNGSVSRFVLALPEGDLLNMTAGGLAVSRDGRKLVYAVKRDGVSQLFLRNRDQVSATAIAGTENARLPFFSPDGEWLAFFRDRALWKVSLSAGSPQRLCDAENPAGASWSRDDTIVVSLQDGDLLAVPTMEGDPTTLDGGSFSSINSPKLLRDGELLMFVDSINDPSVITVRNRSNGEDRALIDGSDPRVIDDYLVFVRESSLWAVPFDVERAALTGAAVPVVDDVNVLGTWEFGSYDIATDGSLTYVSGTHSGRLVVVDPAGESTVVAELPDYHSISLSPDGLKVAGDGQQGIWVHDLEKGTRLRIAEGYYNAFWSPDGSSLAYGRNFVIKAADGGGDERVLLDDVARGRGSPSSWSPDGAWIAGGRYSAADGSADIWLHSLSGEARAFLATPANELGAAFSPDGRWLAYHSDQSGRFEVYVVPFPGPGERVAVSAKGGTTPVWSPDGSELHFRQDTAVMTATVSGTDKFTASPPRQVLDGPYWLDPTGHLAFGVFPDGKLLMIDTGQANEIHVVLDWVEELKRLVPQP